MVSQSKTKRIVSTTVDLQVPRAPMTQFSPGWKVTGQSSRYPALVRSFLMFHVMDMSFPLGMSDGRVCTLEAELL